MSGYTVYIKTESPTPDGVVSQRAEVRARKESFEALGDKWVDEFLPRHFQPGNKERYGFTPRDAQYLERKRKMARRAKAGPAEDGIHLPKSRQRRAVQYEGEVDLVLHGDLADDVTSNYEVKGFPSRTTIRLGSGRLPYLVQRPRRSRTVNMAKDIFTVTPEELRSLIVAQAAVYFTELARGSVGINVGGDHWDVEYGG